MALIAGFLKDVYVWSGILAALIIVVVTSLFSEVADEFFYKGVPIVGKENGEVTNKKAKMRFLMSARSLIKQGFDQGYSRFQIMATFRPVIVLHPKYMEELKSHPDLSFEEAMNKAFFGGKYPGFDVFAPIDHENILLDVVRGNLTQALNSLAIPLSKETAASLEGTFPPSKEWKQYIFAQQVPLLVARISSLAFLGTRICRNKDWLNVSVNYTIDSFNAVRVLRLWPPFLRPIVHWFLPEVQKLRDHLRVARHIVQDEVEQRKLIREGKIPEPEPPRTHPDVLDWFRETAAGRPFDYALGQVALSLAAIHTTSYLLTSVMYDLTANPEFIDALREEIRKVLQEDGGIQKSSLSKMKLLDSVLKETLRLNPTGMTVLHRVATRNITLSDGAVLPKGATVVVSGHSMRDAAIYEDPETWDGYRFLRLREQPGSEHRYQLVTTSNQDLGFGCGTHVCAGRFFAANEIKIILIHLLLKYDWKFEKEDQDRPPSIDIGTEMMANPMVSMLFKSREPGIDLASLGL
ncbi:hypothetical protein ASPZODRAFT_99457 [Penicilliopsis zonata CBS 506.65]|uniref:Cytochrome P450 monooxygenase n=1 Tax=Penicilliopsis zonata CBS 506.65 TaxID=1073090 RepID=A0A1L9SDX8_9EURO|nr:hypothetical protein ASPZODRAFT_99457 [Penicilliopsis zonata CBS 506.65]OJJ45420.1 hypothetical protein ASPZODRAFT_99457 [Penicilliopsis zonata CBS 506.65]